MRPFLRPSRSESLASIGGFAGQSGVERYIVHAIFMENSEGLRRRLCPCARIFQSLLERGLEEYG